MKKFWPTILLVLLCTSVAASQQKKPTPPDDDVVKISTSLIQIDVSVTDSKGRVITDLKQNEIEIYENGQKQAITNFSFISSIKPTPTQKPTPVNKSAVPAPPVVLRPDRVRRTFALVVDDLSLSFQSAHQTRRALRKFVDEQMQEGDLVAIIRTGVGIGALQQFTADKRILYAAIEKVKWNPEGSGGVGVFAPIEPATDTSLQTDPNADPDDILPTYTGPGQSLNDFRKSVFATGTLGALKYIVTGMSELPGRKSVVLFSDGFKMFETDSNGMQESGRVFDFLQQLVDAANRSAVVIYTIDARGLVTTALTAEDNVSDTSPDAMASVNQSRLDELLDTQEGLGYLADETGGFAVKNANDLSRGVRKIMDDQSYYLVGYEPDADTFDAAERKFNKLEVKVLRKGATARYRSGFFNVADKPVEKIPTAMSPVAQLESALVSPFAVNGIGLRLNALFGSDEKNGTFVRSLLHIDARDLKFTDEKDGTKRATFDVLAMSFGDNGNVVDQLGKTYALGVKGDAYQKVLAEGFVYQFAFPVKTAGAYQYRVAIRDTQGGKVGSASQFIEVPDLKKNRLTVSGILLENVSGGAARSIADTIADTALRRIKAGSTIRYRYVIYNAKLGQTNQPDLKARIRVFHEGNMILDGKEKAVDLRNQNMRSLQATGALDVGNKLPPGDYILQIIVTDQLAKTKQQIATQFVQFEVVE